MFIYLISCLACLERRDISIFGAAISDTSFALANAGLITHGGICIRLGVIPIRYASLCECVMSVIRWLVMQEVGCRFEFARHFESYLARPTPFYMRMRTTISDEPIRLNGAMLTSRGSMYSYSLVYSTYSANVCT